MKKVLLAVLVLASSLTYAQTETPSAAYESNSTEPTTETSTEATATSSTTSAPEATSTTCCSADGAESAVSYYVAGGVSVTNASDFNAASYPSIEFGGMYENATVATSSVNPFFQFSTVSELRRQNTKSI